MGPSGGRCWVSGFAAARTLGFGFRPATDLGFRVSPRRRSWVSGFGFRGCRGETPLGADYVSTPATRGGARRPQPRRRQWRRDVPRQRRPCRERRASGHFGDQNSFGRVSCFTFRWVAVFRVSLFGRQPCFVFHFSVFHVFRVSAGLGMKHRWGPSRGGEAAEAAAEEEARRQRWRRLSRARAPERCQ